MLPYSLVETDMPFSLFPEPGLPLQSRTETGLVNRLGMKMHARADTASESQAAWPEDSVGILQSGNVRQVADVPDAGQTQLIERALVTPSSRAFPLTFKGEGVAYT